MAAPQVPTGSTLLYLFADRVAPKDKALTVGVEVPCKDFKVQKKPLAASMFGAAFFGLRDRGLLSLELVQKKVLLVKTRQVVAKRLGDESGQGLEGAVMDQVSPEGDRVKSIIYRWFGEDRSDPWDDVIQLAADEAVALGVIESLDAERGKVAGFILGKTRLEPDCDAIAGLESAASEFIAKWQNFQTSEPELYKELNEECASGISSRKEQSDD